MSADDDLIPITLPKVTPTQEAIDLWIKHQRSNGVLRPVPERGLRWSSVSFERSGSGPGMIITTRYRSLD